MSENKKWYYMKVKENFYESEEMVLLESMENGCIYSNILLKLYLKSLKYEGKLLFKDRIPYNIKMLSTIVRQNPVMVEKAIEIFKNLGIIEMLDNGTIYMMDIQEYIGHGSNEAERKQIYRLKVKNDEKLLTVGQCPGQRTPEIETEIEKELELDIDTKEIEVIPYKEIIEFLNEKAITKYRYSSTKTKELIATRYKEKFTLTDFKTVITKKCSEWLNTDMEKFLRPETLFSNKFEGYLNQKIVDKQEKADKFNNYEQREYDFTDLEKKLLGND